MADFFLLLCIFILNTAIKAYATGTHLFISRGVASRKAEKKTLILIVF